MLERRQHRQLQIVPGSGVRGIWGSVGQTHQIFIWRMGTQFPVFRRARSKSDAGAVAATRENHPIDSLYVSHVRYRSSIGAM